MCPDFLQGNFYACGLCWLSTTEWVIAYTDENKLETFFLNIKKVENFTFYIWLIRIFDLGYWRQYYSFTVTQKSLE